MDASDVAVDDGVMIAFLPTTDDWSELELPHMTLVYAGSKQDLTPSDFNALAKDAAALAMLCRPFVLKVMGIEIFGDPDEQVQVLKFRPTPELLAMRKYVEHWNKSQHPFNPHATIGPVGFPRRENLYPPIAVGFNRIVVAWGNEHLVFSLT